jgi:hypothetical protein
VTAEVIANRLSLAEAEPRFPKADALLGRDGPAVDEQDVYQGVLFWVAATLRDNPARQAEVCARLKRERGGPKEN